MTELDDYWTILAMRTLGGGFVKALGSAAIQADSDNLRRIKLAWPEYWSRYETLGHQLRIDEEARTYAAMRDRQRLLFPDASPVPSRCRECGRRYPMEMHEDTCGVE